MCAQYIYIYIHTCVGCMFMAVLVCNEEGKERKKDELKDTEQRGEVVKQFFVLAFGPPKPPKSRGREEGVGLYMKKGMQGRDR